MTCKNAHGLRSLWWNQGLRSRFCSNHRLNPTRSVFLTKANFKSEVWPKDAESAKVCIPCRQSGFWTKRWMYQKDSYEQRTKPITSAKGCGWNGHRFSCVPHPSWGFDVCNKIRQTCVSKVIVFCVTPIVPESFMTVSSINVLVWLFQNVGGFGGRSYEVE